MADPRFVHLHVHTHYSLLDGANKVPDLVKRTKELGMDSIAITDHGALFGAVEFYNEAKKEGIKPIIGIEAYMAPGARTDRSTPTGNPGEAAYHLLLLAQNAEGYKNLLKLASTAYRDGFYYKPRIDKDVLREHAAGLVATSACLGGEIPSALVKRDMKAAKQVAETYLQIFGPDRFFIEVQKHIAEQDQVNPELVELANKLGIGVVGTNDVHFLKKEDHFAHGVLCCISMGRLITDENRLKYSEELYLKSPAEMAEAMGQFPQALENTVRVAQMCELQLDFGKKYAPVYRVPEGVLREIADCGLRIADLKTESDQSPIRGGAERSTPKSAMNDDERYLRQLCEDGLDWRYGTRDVSPEIRARLEYELKIICMKNFCSYFLIVWDFCNYARSQGIPVGARGSGVGTMVGYLLGLCNVDPIRYGLLFERFMDPSRNEMPDIDIDICQDGRQKVIEYVRNKYGHVAQIITFGTLAAKAACKDVGRVLGVPLPEVDKLTKLIPGTPGMTLKKAIAQVPELDKLYKENPQITQVIDIAQKLEGMCRNAGCHAAGVIIADQPIENIAPLYKDSDGNILTQFEGPIAEKVGLLKMDFLGLRTLSTLQRAIDLEFQTRAASGEGGSDEATKRRSDEATNPQSAIRNPQSPPLTPDGKIDIERIDLTDKNVLALFCRGETRGIFQFESGGMQDLLMKMQPDRVEDLIAANALYRPGPMELIPSYCARKHGKEAIPSVHPIMDAILKETYGIMVYQEQVMQIFNQLGGIELANAYKLIKAISKKQVEVIAKFQPEFIKGCMSKGVSKDKADELFDLILKFGGYGFNKSHSTRYAIVAFQTAYMKVYHPVEYMAALLTYEMGSTEKVVEYIDECRRLSLPDGSKGVKVLPPDVNYSDLDFTPVYQESDEATKRRSDRGKKNNPQSAIRNPKSLEGVIRFGLMAVKGIGPKPCQAIIEERTKAGPFKGLFEFCERVDLHHVSRASLEMLVKCGAFSSLGAKRSQLLQILERAVELGQQTQADKRNGQFAMFGAPEPSAAASAPALPQPLPDIAELEPAELLKHEKDLLGFYITSHPLTEHQTAIERYSTCSTKDLINMAEGSEITIGGMFTSVRKKVTKTGRSAGQQMAIVTLEDLEGTIDGMIFADDLAQISARYPDAVSAERIVFLKGKIDKKRENPCIIVSDIVPIEESAARFTTSVVLQLDRTRHQPDVVTQLKPLLSRHKGNTPVFAQVAWNGGQSVILKLNEIGVKPSRPLVDDLELLLGTGQIQLHGVGSKRIKRLQQQRLFKEEPAEPETAPATDESAAAAMDAAAMDGPTED